MLRQFQETCSWGFFWSQDLPHLQETLLPCRFPKVVDRLLSSIFATAQLWGNLAKQRKVCSHFHLGHLQVHEQMIHCITELFANGNGLMD